MARMTMDQIKAARPQVDRAKLDATTEEEIVRQMIEDGEDPHAEFGAFIEDLQPARIRAQLGMSQPEFAAALTIPVATRTELGARPRLARSCGPRPASNCRL